MSRLFSNVWSGLPTAQKEEQWRPFHVLGRVLLYLCLGVSALSMVIPFLWMISTSLKDEGSVFLFPPTLMPDPVVWDNYPYVFRNMPFDLFVYNSFKIATLSAVGYVLACSLAGFAFARLRFRGRDWLFAATLTTMMIPAQVTMIPVYLLFNAFGWIDTHLPLIVPAFFGGAFGTFLFRQFYLTLPQELMDAARIDGCSWFDVWWRIFLPLSKPATATLALFVFMNSWNDLLGPLIYLNSEELWTIPMGLAMFRGMYYTIWTHLMAGSVIAVLPILVLFVILQKYYVQGIALTGLKQ